MEIKRTDYMKRISLLATAAAAVFAIGLSGCSKEKTILPKGEPSRLVLTGTALQAETKADTEPLQGGMELGVHIVDVTSGESLNDAALTNIKHATDASGAIGNTNPDPIILTTGYLYDVYAYSPYNASVTAATTSTVRVSHGMDVLWAKAAGEKPNAATHNTELIFEHRTAQISFVPVADPASNPDLTGARLSVTGFAGLGFLDLATGKITIDPSMHAVEHMGSDVSFCFLPDAGEMSLNVTVEIPSGRSAGVYSGVITQVFEPGTSYRITVNVVDRNSQLGLTGGVVPWVNETGNVDVNN